MGNPVALVTGGRQGLGRAIALRMADAGFDVAVLDLVDDELAQSLVKDIRGKSVSAYFSVMDLADTTTHAAALTGVESALGPVDALVNNAGIAARPLTDLLDIGEEAFDTNLGVNLRGSFFFTQAVARLMVARRSRHYRSISFISSIAANHVSTDRSPYCVSKAGLSMVTKLYADRLGQYGIAVNEIRPGFIETEMTASAPTDKIDAYIDSGAVAQRRWGKPLDVAEVVTSLANGSMPYVTGQAIHVDGGFHIPVA